MTCIRRSGDANGSGRISTAFTTLNMAVFAPMARAIVITAAVVKPGDRLKLRTPYRTSAKQHGQGCKKKAQVLVRILLLILSLTQCTVSAPVR